MILKVKQNNWNHKGILKALKLQHVNPNHLVLEKINEKLY